MCKLDINPSPNECKNNFRRSQFFFTHCTFMLTLCYSGRRIYASQDIPSMQLVSQYPASQGSKGSQWENLLSVARHVSSSFLQENYFGGDKVFLLIHHHASVLQYYLRAPLSSHVLVRESCMQLNCKRTTYQCYIYNQICL